MAQLSLLPEDLAWATWRPEARRTRGEPVALDQEAALAKVAGAPARKGAWEAYEHTLFEYWRAQGLPDALTPEHAHFWFEALSSRHLDVAPVERVKLLEKKRWSGKVSAEAVRTELSNAHYVLPGQLNAAAVLLGEGALWDVISALNKWHLTFRGFRSHVAPLFSDKQRAKVVKQLAPHVTVKKFPKDVYACSNGGGLDRRWHVAAAMGMHDALRAICESWSPNHFKDYRWAARPHLMIFGLGSGELVIEHFRRQKLTLDSPASIRAWLAHTGTDALDEVQRAIDQAKKHVVSKRLQAALDAALGRAPEPD